MSPKLKCHKQLIAQLDLQIYLQEFCTACLGLVANYMDWLLVTYVDCLLVTYDEDEDEDEDEDNKDGNNDYNNSNDAKNIKKNERQRKYVLVLITTHLEKLTGLPYKGFCSTDILHSILHIYFLLYS